MHQSNHTEQYQQYLCYYYHCYYNYFFVLTLVLAAQGTQCAVLELRAPFQTQDGVQYMQVSLHKRDSVSILEYVLHSFILEAFGTNKHKQLSGLPKQSMSQDLLTLLLAAQQCFYYSRNIALLGHPEK